MPSALETLVKILKLERERGYDNTAVIGGLSAFSARWVSEAHTQARRLEHHRLVDELEQILSNYDGIQEQDTRHTTVQYMLDRIMGRVPAPPEFQVTEEEAQAPPPEKPKPRPTPAAKPREEQPKRQERQKSPAEPAPQQPKRQPRPEAPKATREPKEAAQGERQSALFDDHEIIESGEMDLPVIPRLARPPRQRRPQQDPEAAADILRGLNKPVTVVQGVGERLAKSLAKLGVHTVNDLLFFFPRRHDDYTRMASIAHLQPDTNATVIGTVRSAEIQLGNNKRKDFYLVLDDGTGLLSVVFFGQHYLSRYIRAGQQLVFRGKVGIFRNQLQMSSPEWEHLEVNNLQRVGIVPVYPLTEGLKAAGLRRLMEKAVTYWAEHLPDYVPEITLDRTELADLGWAIKNKHFPEGFDHLDHANRRLAFDELLLLQLAILANRHDWQSLPADPLPVSDDFLDAFVSAVFPYPLTNAQRKAIEDIRRDISQAVPMNRLLQGDVGSGKTAVSVAAMAFAVHNGKQAALMAPTSILAEQHYRNISRSFEKMPGDKQPSVALLTSALTASQRQNVYAGIADGSIDIVIGTHAIIQEGVNFKDLGLAVIDEQHRFGVEQRGALRGKGDNNPHLLVMTATPIPRTMALTLHADLDLTVIDEMPPGRIPIQTKVIDPIARERAFSFVEAEMAKGRQAFIVHPLVEQSEKIDARSALEAYEELKQIFFRYRVGLLHGRMKPTEKDAVMTAFNNHEYDVLVTTSVAEVGVDVPNASVIVIEGANRFGLAQLHQFRGRVGRGEHASYCLLIPDSSSEESRERLQAMEQYSDGFKLAEIDWKIRGAGDLLGTRQSGQDLFRLLEFISPELVELAQRESRTIYAEDPKLELPEHRLLAQRVKMLFDERADMS
jgi:ATP-dependent DNA helicase RecG